jgi:hypothetical protein
MTLNVGQIVSVKWNDFQYIRAVVIQKPKNGNVVVDVGLDEYEVPIQNVKKFNRGR